MRKEKLVYVISSGKSGGAERHLLDILKKSNSDKYEMILIVPLLGTYNQSYEKFADKIYKIDIEKSKSFVSLIRGILKILNAEKPKIIYAHLFKAIFLAAIANIFSKQKSTFYGNLHAEVSDEVSIHWIKKRIFQGLIFLLQFIIDKYIAVSDYNAKMMMRQFVAKQKIVTIYNGIDETEFYEVKSEKSSEYFIINYIGRLQPQKGVDTLTQIAKKLEKDKYRIHIYGEGELKLWLLNEIKQHQLHHVELKGFSRNIRKAINQSNLLILPSKGDVFGLVIAESMACGKAIVASDVGGIPELLIDGKGGFLCSPGDIDCFVEKINYLEQHPHLLEKFGEFNQQYFNQNFTLNQMMFKLEALYDVNI